VARFEHQQLDKPDAPKPKASATESRSLGAGQAISGAPVWKPITGAQRVKWFFVSSAGPESLLAGGFTAAIGTARDKPAEYGPHWLGFTKRYGMRFTGVATSNAMEAGLGSFWGEDPRYVRAPERSTRGRIGNALLLTVYARNRDGRNKPAYARYAAFAGSNFLSNTWRADSESDASSALARTGWAFVGRLAANAFDEFWPDLSVHLPRGLQENLRH
jgi:hypothetical protein